MNTFTENPPRLPGTRPAGTNTEREASKRVQQMFSRIAPRYDFLNHLLSFSLDRIWRRRTARKFRRILRRTDARILDLCCGTGDLTFALERVRIRELRDATAHRTPLFGSDFAQPMLDRAQKKARAHSSLRHLHHRRRHESSLCRFHLRPDHHRLRFSQLW